MFLCVHKCKTKDNRFAKWETNLLVSASLNVCNDHFCNRNNWETQMLVETSKKQKFAGLSGYV